MRLLAGILAFAAISSAAPSMAFANTDDRYVSAAQVSVEPAVIAPGGRSNITFSPGSFGASESVTVSISGVLAGQAHVLTSSGAEALTSDSVGGLTAVFVAPNRGSGPYAVAFLASRDYVAVITVIGPSKITKPDTASPDDDIDGGVDDGGINGNGNAGEQSAADGAAPAPDREGRVQIPPNPPEAPDWPGLDEVPWGIVLLAGIALVVCSVSTTLLIAAIRRV